MNQKAILYASMGGGVLLAVVLAMFLPMPGEEKMPEIDESKFVSWQSFSSTDNSFTARFPQIAETRNNDLRVSGGQTLGQKVYSAKDNKDNAYLIVSTEYPEVLPVESAEELLRLALDGMVQSDPSNKLIHSKFAKLHGQPSLEFVIEDGQKLNNKGHITMKDKIMYQIFEVYETKDFDEMAHNYFITSFQTR
ncbi:MAG: hypothetical protein HY817_04980 [Candidatus Abawacabacteria bacterium]|nr:hypothetical protein [Candidatus Abawacabacteria bacterium]